MPDDDENLNSDLTPSFDDFERVLIAKLQDLIDFLDQDPPLSEVDRIANKIIGTLLNALSTPKVVDWLVALYARAYVPLERLGRWTQWDEYFLQIQSAFTDDNGDNSNLTEDQRLTIWYESLITHFQYKGKPAHYRKAMEFLREIIHLDECRPMQENISALATQIDVYDASVENLDLAREAMNLARRLGNQWLEGRVFSILGIIYANNMHPYRAFENGQMAYCLGRATTNDILITNGLHLMALGCQLSGQKERTFEYLTLATAYADQTGDVARQAYLELTWGSCYLRFGDFRLAERYSRQAMEKFDKTGWYYASSTYTCGIALYYQGNYADAKGQLLKASREYQRSGDQYNYAVAEHALSCLFDKLGQHREAEQRCLMVIQTAKESAKNKKDTRFDYLIKVASEDLAKFRTNSTRQE